MEPTLALIRERFGSLVVGEGAEDVADGRRRATRPDRPHAGDRRVVHRRPDRPHDHRASPGVSPYYLGGVVSYANEAKVELLGVAPALIEAHGAVSPEVAAAMADGVRRRLGADLGLSITGVAGPSGGTPEKPVGLVYLGLATADRVQTRRLDLGPEQPRDVIQRRSAKMALNWAPPGPLRIEPHSVGQVFEACLFPGDNRRGRLKPALSTRGGSRAISRRLPPRGPAGSRRRSRRRPGRPCGGNRPRRKGPASGPRPCKSGPSRMTPSCRHPQARLLRAPLLDSSSGARKRVSTR